MASYSPFGFLGGNKSGQAQMTDFSKGLMGSPNSDIAAVHASPYRPQPPMTTPPKDLHDQAGWRSYHQQRSNTTPIGVSSSGPQTNNPGYWTPEQQQKAQPTPIGVFPSQPGPSLPPVSSSSPSSVQTLPASNLSNPPGFELPPPMPDQSRPSLPPTPVQTPSASAGLSWLGNVHPEVSKWLSSMPWLQQLLSSMGKPQQPTQPPQQVQPTPASAGGTSQIGAPVSPTQAEPYTSFGPTLYDAPMKPTPITAVGGGNGQPATPVYSNTQYQQQMNQLQQSFAASTDPVQKYQLQQQINQLQQQMGMSY